MDWVKVDGVWKETDAIFVKVSDVWKEADQVYANSGGSWVEGWTGMTEPILQHTAQGEFTVVSDETNLRKATNYAVFRRNGEITTASVNGNVISLGDLHGEFYVSDYRDVELKKATKFYRERITYNYVAVPPTCTDKCGLRYDCNSPIAPSPCIACWGERPDGYECCGGICCGGSRGQNCTPNPDRPVKNPVPNGFAERYSEWVRIENPTTAREIQEKDTGVFAIKKVEWDNKYYMEVPMPPPYPAKAYDEEGLPTGEVLENVPAWDYNKIYFIHYDPDGEIIWMRDNINNPECFTLVEKEPMKNYEMWVSNLPIAYEGTYEFVVCNDDEVFVREEGNV